MLVIWGSSLQASQFGALLDFTGTLQVFQDVVQRPFPPWCPAPFVTKFSPILPPLLKRCSILLKWLWNDVHFDATGSWFTR